MSPVREPTYAFRCRWCGHVFTPGEMMIRHKDRQRDLPQGLVWCQCPRCKMPIGGEVMRVPLEFTKNLRSQH